MKIAACPSACNGHDDYADAPTDTVDFMLTSVSGDTATASVNAASNLSSDAVGEPVTIKLVTGIGCPYTGAPASVSGITVWPFRKHGEDAGLKLL